MYFSVYSSFSCLLHLTLCYLSVFLPQALCVSALGLWLSVAANVKHFAIKCPLPLLRYDQSVSRTKITEENILRF